MAELTFAAEAHAISAAMADCCVTGAGWPREGRDEESWQLAVLAEQIGALGIPEPPAEDELPGLPPDPDGDQPPDTADDIPAALLIEAAAAERAAAAPEVFPAGLWLRDGRDPDAGFAGTGFAAGGVLDTLRPGGVLAGFAEDTWTGGLDAASDDELIGAVRAWRRLSSWAAAGELAAVAELSARRENDSQPDPVGLGYQPADCVADELACALTLTRRSAENLADRASQMLALPATAAALRLGQIDMPKALTILDGVQGTEQDVARAVAERVLAKAPRQTTGELRAAVRRAVLAADPAAATRRRESAQKSARVELWDEPAGTKALAGRDLPPAEVLAADKRISAIARELKNRGADAGLDLLRAKVYLALLAGQPLDDLLARADTSEHASAPASAGADPDPRATPADEDSTTGHDQAGQTVPTASASADPDPGATPADEDSTTGHDQAGQTIPAASASADPDPRATPADEDSTTGHDQAGQTIPAEQTASAGQMVPAGLRRGQPPTAGILPHSPAPGLAAGSEVAGPAGFGRLASWVNLTVPLTTLLNLADSPGEVAGFGPIDAQTSRLLAEAATRHPSTRWCLTVTDDNDCVIGHGCQRGRASPGHPEPAQREAAPGPGSTGSSGTGSSGSGTTITPARADDPAIGTWNLVVKLDRLAFPECGHQRETRGYELSPRLRHLIEIRDRTCSFPGCRRPAVQCDKDHTVPYHQGGRTCECNITPLCRAHHKVKQALGWKLAQPRPGVLEWTTPSGRKYWVNEN